MSKEEQTPFFRRKSFCVLLILLLIIAVIIVIFPRQEKIIFEEYTLTHSLTRYYTELDYARSSQLIKAIDSRDHAEIEKLLAINMEVNYPNRAKTDWTNIENGKNPEFPLEVACAIGDYKIVKALIESGAIVSDELLPITILVFNTDDLAILQLLVEHGADASQEGLALTAASMTWNHKRRKYTDMDLAGTVTVFKFLETNGADIYEVDKEGNNVVINAASTDNVHLLMYLIGEKQMDINSANIYHTALIVASSTGKVNSVRYLVEHGADQAIKDSRGLTALEVVKKQGREEIVEILSGGG